MSSIPIKVRGVRKRYPTFTLLRILIGLVRADSGVFVLDGIALRFPPLRDASVIDASSRIHVGFAIIGANVIPLV